MQGSSPASKATWTRAISSRRPPSTRDCLNLFILVGEPSQQVPPAGAGRDRWRCLFRCLLASHLCLRLWIVIHLFVEIHLTATVCGTARVLELLHTILYRRVLAYESPRLLLTYNFIRQAVRSTAATHFEEGI
eukprot:611553-Amphidinium_carterae.3